MSYPAGIFMPNLEKLKFFVKNNCCRAETFFYSRYVPVNPKSKGEFVMNNILNMEICWILTTSEEKKTFLKTYALIYHL
jgi:hypothetical protein